MGRDSDRRPDHSSVVLPDYTLVSGSDFRGADFPSPADTDEVEKGASRNHCHGYGDGDQGRVKA